MSNEEMQRSDLHAIRFYLYQVFHSCFAIKPCESQFECLKNSETIEILGLFSRSQTYLDAVAGFVESVGKIDYNEAAAEFSRLFEQPGRPPVPFWESYYLTGEHVFMLPEAAEVRDAYLQNACVPTCLLNVPNDSIGLELAYMEKLASRCMMAFDQGDEISYSKNAKASLEFLEKHLGTWIPKFFVRMAEFHHVDYYSHVSYLLINFIVEDKILLRDDIECIRGIDV